MSVYGRWLIALAITDLAVTGWLYTQVGAAAEANPLFCWLMDRFPEHPFAALLAGKGAVNGLSLAILERFATTDAAVLRRPAVAWYRDAVIAYAAILFISFFPIFT